MVSSDEINRRLEARRRGEKYQEPRERRIEMNTGSSSNECPDCHTQNPSTAKFCVGCGRKMETPPEREEGFSPRIKGPGEEQTPRRVSSRPDDFGSSSQRIKSAEESPTEKKLEPIVSTEEGENIRETHSISEEGKLQPPEAEKTLKTTQEAAPERKKPETFKTPAPSETPIQPSITVEEPTSHKKSEVDPVERIKKAKELLDIGAITQEEFNTIKKKYLADI